MLQPHKRHEIGHYPLIKRTEMHYNDYSGTTLHFHQSAPSEANVSPLRGVGHDGTSEQKTREGRIALMRGVQSPPVTVFMEVSF